MGISRDSRHKRRATGGKKANLKKKRLYESGRPPAMTKIGPARVHTVRVRGGNQKFRAMKLDTGNFSWGSEGEHFLLLVQVSLSIGAWCTFLGDPSNTIGSSR